MHPKKVLPLLRLVRRTVSSRTLDTVDCRLDRLCRRWCSFSAQCLFAVFIQPLCPSSLAVPGTAQLSSVGTRALHGVWIALCPDTFFGSRLLISDAAPGADFPSINRFGCVMLGA